MKEKYEQDPFWFSFHATIIKMIFFFFSNNNHNNVFVFNCWWALFTFLQNVLSSIIQFFSTVFAFRFWDVRSVILSHHILTCIFLIIFPSFSLFLFRFFLLFFPCLSVFYLSRYCFCIQVYSAVETVICIPIRDYERTGPSGFLTSVVIRTIKKIFFFCPMYRDSIFKNMNDWHSV